MGLIHAWHDALGMRPHDEAWHQGDIADELRELQEARGLLHRWSELSDVAYTYTRAHWDGFRAIKRPIKFSLFFFGLLYMFPKYTLRWWFYRVAGRRTDPHARIHEVRNPRKEEKLRHIAEKNQIDPERFIHECKNLLRWWPLLP